MSLTVSHPVLTLPRSSVFAATALALVLMGCKDQAAGTAAAPVQPAAVAAPVAPAAPVVAAASPAQPPPAAAATVPAAATPAPAAVSAEAAAPRKLPLGVQGVAPAGVTVRVKGVEIGGDATVLDVSISFANRITNSTMLALADTYVQDESGAKLHIKRPDTNRDLTIREGETLNGQLVFLGSVAPTARRLKLVFNEGAAGDNIVSPGFSIDLPLQGG